MRINITKMNCALGAEICLTVSAALAALKYAGEISISWGEVLRPALIGLLVSAAILAVVVAFFIRQGKTITGIRIGVQNVFFLCTMCADTGVTTSVILAVCRLAGKTAMTWKQILLPCGIGVLLGALFGGLVFLLIRYSRNRE